MVEAKPVINTKENLRRIGDGILAFQPLFAVPIYFSVLTSVPPFWLSVLIGLVPLGVRYCLSGKIINKTPFDIPILIFISGTLVGFVVASDKTVAAGALFSTLASILIYYGITSNCKQKTKYWLYFAGVIGFITLGMAVWFFSQGNGRQLFFNRWIFNIFGVLPKTDINLQMHGLGLLLTAVIPPFFSIVLSKQTTFVRVTCLLISIFFVFLLVLTDSGTGWIALACGITFVFICWRVWMTGVLVPIAITLVWTGFALYDKVQWLAESLSTQHFIDRINLTVNTIHMLNGWHAVTGLGLGGWFRAYYEKYGAETLHSHNAYVQLYSDTGILGAVALLAAYVVFVRITMDIVAVPKWSTWRWVGVGTVGSIIAGAVFSLFDVTTTGTVGTPGNYIYLSVPLLWVCAAFFVNSHSQSVK